MFSKLATDNGAEKGTKTYVATIRIFLLQVPGHFGVLHCIALEPIFQIVCCTAHDLKLAVHLLNLLLLEFELYLIGGAGIRYLPPESLNGLK